MERVPDLRLLLGWSRWAESLQLPMGVAGSCLLCVCLLGYSEALHVGPQSPLSALGREVGGQAQLLPLTLSPWAPGWHPNRFSHSPRNAHPHQ